MTRCVAVARDGMAEFTPLFIALLFVYTVAICYNAYLQTCRTGCPTPAVLFVQSPPHPIRTVK